MQRRAQATPAAPAPPAAPSAAPAAAPATATPVSAPQASKVAAVRMTGEPTLKLSVDGGNERQFLTPALHECVDLYLQAAQTGSRHCVLLWPGTLESLPLIHALATLERWALGYKRGLRSVLYPATAATFYRLNDIYVSRQDISTFNSMWQEVTEPRQEVPKQHCPEKDLMLFALAGRYRDDQIQPCLNELLPHFLLETGQRKEVAALNYGATYLSHVVTKLAKRRQKKDLQGGAFPALGPAATAPDATFALSYKMTRQEITEALTTLKNVGGIDAVLLDATRVAFDRVEKAQNRIATFMRCLTEVFGADGPGVLIVTNDPRQMTYVRAALKREEQARSQHYRIEATRGCRLAVSGRGFQPDGRPESTELAEAAISVEVTDRETAKLANQAYRLSQQKHLPPDVIEAVNRASKFVQMMGNLPSAPAMLYKSLDESMADPALRRRYDWVDLRNGLNRTLAALAPSVRRPFTDWLAQATKVLERQESGTPLARAMVTLAKRYAAAGEKVLVIVQSGFYQRLATEFFLSEPDIEDFAERVAFASLAQRQQKRELLAPDRLIVCAMAPDLLREVVTSPTLPCAIDFLLTQHTATATYHALAPVLQLAAFKPYEQRVRAIHDRIQIAQANSGAVLPEFDYQTPTFTLTTPGGGANVPGSDRGPTDFVEIEVEDGERIVRGRQSHVYVYDPANADSRSLGFRCVNACEIKQGQRILIMSEAMREQAEAAFDAAGVVFGHAGAFEALLRQYHRKVQAAVAARFPGSVATAARAIRDAMAARNCPQDASNISYWINLKNAEKTTFNDLMPQAPRHFDTFRVFMQVLGFDATDTQTFWDGVVKRVRGTRIADGISVGDHYARALFDPDAAAVYDRLPADALKRLRSGALDSVYEVTAVSFGTTHREAPDARPAL